MSQKGCTDYVETHSVTQISDHPPSLLSIFQVTSRAPHKLLGHWDHSMVCGGLASPSLKEDLLGRIHGPHLLDADNYRWTSLQKDCSQATPQQDQPFRPE